MTGLASSCGACKFLRRRCTSDCIFAPYFSYEQAASHFAAVHKIFGASNVSKLLLHLPLQNRNDAAVTISYEALARMRDPIYGCVAHIFALQQQVTNLQEEIELLENHLASQMIRVTGSGSSQAHLGNPCDQPYFSSHHHHYHTNTLNYHNQPAEVINQVETINSTQAFPISDNQMNVSLPTLHEWENQNFVSELSPFCLEKLLEGVDQEIIACDQWLEISNNCIN